jgi:hypothetical protein
MMKPTNNKIEIYERAGLIGHIELLIEGDIVDGVSVYQVKHSDSAKPTYCVFTERISSLIKMYSLKVSELKNANISIVIFNYWSEVGIYSINVRFEPEIFAKQGDCLTFELLADLLLWNRSYVFIDYFNKFEELLKSNRIGELLDDGVGAKIRIKVKSFSTDETIESKINNALEQIIRIHYLTLEILDNLSYENSILAAFNFPEQFKVPCRQYLEYFAQFLQDLGINATSNLKEEAGKVLFSVTPTDDKEALDKIREALAIYLSLASNPIPNSTGDRTVDMVLSGARANAKHLESQLELTVAKLQFKEATLELKDATIGQNQLALRQKNETIKELQEIISRGNIFEESLEKVEINGEVIEATDLYRFSRGEDNDIEISATPILETANEETKVGLVKFHEVTKFKDYGASFDLPQLIRDLMKYFNRNKD